MIVVNQSVTNLIINTVIVAKPKFTPFFKIKPNKLASVTIIPAGKNDNEPIIVEVKYMWPDNNISKSISNEVNIRKTVTIASILRINVEGRVLRIISIEKSLDTDSCDSSNWLANFLKNLIFDVNLVNIANPNFVFRKANPAMKKLDPIIKTIVDSMIFIKTDNIPSANKIPPRSIHLSNSTIGAVLEND